MKKSTLVIYWIVTGLLSAFLLFAAYLHLSGDAEITANTEHLKFNVGMMPFLGVLKILAVAVILAGRRGDLTVGAYAGVFFYGLGAMALHVVTGDPMDKVSGGAMIAALGLISYFLWRRTRGRVGAAPVAARAI